MSRTIFYTFRPHPNELQVFEDWLAVFIPFVEEHSSFAWVVEKDHQITRHFHTVFVGKYRDLSSFEQTQRKKQFLKYKKNILAGGQTNSHGWDTQMVKADTSDLLKTLGYVMKDPNSRTNYSGYTDAYVVEAVKFYYAQQRLLAREPTTKDYVIVNDKNFYRMVEEFILNQENDTSIEDPHLYHKMARQRLMIQISNKKSQYYLCQLASAMGQDTEYHGYIIDEYQGGYDFSAEQLDELKHAQETKVYQKTKEWAGKMMPCPYCPKKENSLINKHMIHKSSSYEKKEKALKEVFKD